MRRPELSESLTRTDIDVRRLRILDSLECLLLGALLPLRRSLIFSRVRDSTAELLPVHVLNPSVLCMQKGLHNSTGRVGRYSRTTEVQTWAKPSGRYPTYVLLLVALLCPCSSIRLLVLRCLTLGLAGA